MSMTLKSFAIAAVSAALFVGALPAATDAAAPATRAAAEAWAVDKAQSRIGFRATQEGTAFEGNFRNWNAAINFDPKHLATSKVVVNVATGSAFSGDADRDQTLPGDDWFAVKRFPTATFVSQKFVDQGGGKYQVIGDLSMKGVHRQVVLPFTLTVTGDVAHASGALTLDRTLFNVGAGKWKAPDEVGTKVTVVVTVVARKTR
jgi:polyisoprenoid-binding protein YceI